MEFQVTTNALHDGYADFAAGDMNLALFRRQEMAEMVGTENQPADVECQDKVVLIFSVADLEEVYQNLRHKGIRFTKSPMNNPYYGIKTAYVRDPDGNLIGLFQQIV
jgi:predicted enzyme related to lactoylglutathione lyase